MPPPIPTDTGLLHQELQTMLCLPFSAHLEHLEMKQIFLPILLAGLFGTSIAHAITVTPVDATVAVSPAFGSATEIIGAQYQPFGLVFSQAAVFSDPPLAWAGINSAGVVDLVSPLDAYFVLPNTSTNAITNYLSVEIGYADIGSLTLEAFDINGNLLGSTFNDDGVGPHGRTLATLNLAGIHSFKVSGADYWGMTQVEFNDLASVNAVPEPETCAMMFAGLGVLGFARRHRKASAAA